MPARAPTYLFSIGHSNLRLNMFQQLVEGDAVDVKRSIANLAARTACSIRLTPANNSTTLEEVK